MLKKAVYIMFVCFVALSCKTKQSTASNGGVSDERERTKVKELIIAGTTEKVLGNYDQAEAIFLRVLELDANAGVAFYELSGIYEAKKDASKTIAMAQKAVELSPENEWYLAHLARIYMVTNQFSHAENSYLKLTEQYPGNSEYLFNLAEVYLYQGKLKESLPLYNKIEEQMGVSEELILHKNKIHMQLNQADSAIFEMQKLIESNPMETRYYGILAEIYENMGESQLALENYNKILSLEPDNGYVHLSLYEYYKYHGQKDKSNQELKLAFKSQKVSMESKADLLSEFFINSERNEELKALAYELLDTVLEVHPKNAKGYAIYADYLGRDYKDAEAAKMLIKAVEYDPSDYNLQYQLMLVLSINKDFKALVDESSKSMELFPNQPAFYYFNGIGNIQIKDYEKANETLEIGKDFVIDNDELKMEFFQYLGDVNHQLEQHDLSDYYYDEALLLQPNNYYVLNNYSYYLSLRKEKLDKAEVMSKRVVEAHPNNATYLDTYGWVLYQNGKYLDAELWLQKALDNGGISSGEVLEHYGDALYQLGKKDDAISYWKKAAEKNDASDLIEEKIEKGKLIE